MGNNQARITILFDHQIFEMQPHGGISRIFTKLTNIWTENQTINPLISVKITDNEFVHSISPNNIVPGGLSHISHPRSITNSNSHSLLNTVKWHIRSRYYTFTTEKMNEQNIQNSIDVLKTIDFDIFHPTYFDPYFLPYLKGRPFIITVYDLIHERYPELYPLDDITTLNKRILIEKATHIIAISESTKNDIMSFYNTPSEKITVVHLGNEISDSNKLSNHTDDSGIPSQFLLFVGSRHKYKNFYFFLETVSSILVKKKVQVLCFGGGSFTDEEKIFISRLGISDQVIQISGSDNLLVMAYKRALALIYPSLWEGFGVPVIEAFSLNCPVIAGNIPPIVEIGGNAICYIDPKDPDSIRQSVTRICENASYRFQLMQEGKRMVKQYSWEKTAMRMYEVYKSTLE